MKIKKLLGTLAVGTAMLTIAGTASAASLEANIYGSSAQFTFWNAQAISYIQSQPGCSGTTPTQKTYDSSDEVTFATCGGNTYIIRVSSKASYDGILSLEGNGSLAGAATCTSASNGYPGSSLAGYYRLMVDETSCSGATCTALKCARVNVGASDVGGPSFTQFSYGTTDGPQGGAELQMSFSGISTTGLTQNPTIVVPFQFYVNQDVTNSSTGTGTNKTMSNMTRAMAVLLFSGQISNWNQFGSEFPNLPVVLCMRHAGSGTLATLQYAVVGGNGWGGSLVAYENNPNVTTGSNAYSPYATTVYFNNSTGDEEYCVNSQAGAVGYFDADKIVGGSTDGTNGVPKGYPNARGVAYQGEYPTADSITNSRYDFWTNEQAYMNLSDPALTGAELTFINGLLACTTIPSSETNFWVLQNNVNVQKSTDQAYLGN